MKSIAPLSVTILLMLVVLQEELDLNVEEIGLMISGCLLGTTDTRASLEMILTAVDRASVARRAKGMRSSDVELTSKRHHNLVQTVTTSMSTLETTALTIPHPRRHLIRVQFHVSTCQCKIDFTPTLPRPDIATTNRVDHRQST
jgi:hypothetical protein